MKATKTINQKMSAYAELLMKLDRLQQEADDMKNELKNYMDSKEIDVLIGKEHKITYKVVVTNRIDSKALKKDMPEIAEKYSKTSSTKRFVFD